MEEAEGFPVVEAFPGPRKIVPAGFLFFLSPLILFVLVLFSSSFLLLLLPLLIFSFLFYFLLF